jgi:hypothetical protein
MHFDVTMRRMGPKPIYDSSFLKADSRLDGPKSPSLKEPEMSSSDHKNPPLDPILS